MATYPRTIQGMEAWIAQQAADLVKAHGEIAGLKSTVDALRGKGCRENGDGPCGLCPRCAQDARLMAYEADARAIRLERLQVDTQNNLNAAIKHATDAMRFVRKMAGQGDDNAQALLERMEAWRLVYRDPAIPPPQESPTEKTPCPQCGAWECWTCGEANASPAYVEAQRSSTAPDHVAALVKERDEANARVEALIAAIDDEDGRMECDSSGTPEELGRAASRMVTLYCDWTRRYVMGEDVRGDGSTKDDEARAEVKRLRLVAEEMGSVLDGVLATLPGTTAAFDGRNHAALVSQALDELRKGRDEARAAADNWLGLLREIVLQGLTREGELIPSEFLLGKIQLAAIAIGALNPPVPSQVLPKDPRPLPPSASSPACAPGQVESPTPVAEGTCPTCGDDTLNWPRECSGCALNTESRTASPSAVEASPSAGLERDPHKDPQVGDVGIFGPNGGPVEVMGLDDGYVIVRHPPETKLIVLTQDQWMEPPAFRLVKGPKGEQERAGQGHDAGAEVRR